MAPAIDLRPTKYPGLHQNSVSEKRLGALEFSGYGRRRGTRTNKSHLAAQYIEELQQLVDLKLADDATDPSEAGTPVRCCAVRYAVIGARATEFDQHEAPPAKSNTRLTVKHRAGAFEPDGNGREEEEWEHEQEGSQTVFDVNLPMQCFI